MKNLLVLFFSLFQLFISVANASDLAKEQRWADQIVDYIIDGEAEWLAIKNHKILSIYTEAQTPKVKGGAIIIHGSGVHPNWEEVILPLRTSLPEKGWSTLSIQMPVLANDVDYSEYAKTFDGIAPRINAAINFLKQKNINNIVIIAHSLGSTMSAYYLSNTKDSPVKGFVAIGMPGSSKDKRMDNISALKQINIPMLDIYGSNDLDSILNSAKARKQSAAKNAHYSQVITKDANHFFTGKNAELIQAVSNWLNRS